MVIYKATTTATWLDDGVPTQVLDWFEANEGQTVAQCATALNLKPEQVYWSLIQSPLNLKLVGLPTADTELIVSLVDRKFKP